MTEIAPVDVTIHLAASAEDVFRFFTDPARYVQWMDSEAELEPEGGEAGGAGAMPAGSTRVTVTLEGEDGGTRLTLHPARHRPAAQDLPAHPDRTPLTSGNTPPRYTPRT